MSDARYFRVGLFVLTGMFLMGSCAVILGGRSFLRNPVILETAFSESVQGLEVGSPVKLRGVSIGDVSEIGLAQDFYPVAEGTQQALTVVVRMQITGRAQVDAADPAVIAEVERRLHELVASGLRLKLTTQGLTGTSYIEADFQSVHQAPPMQISWTPAHIYVPSAPSTIETISTAIERIFERLEDAEIEEVIANADRLVGNLADGTEGLDLARTQREISILVRDLDAVATELAESFDADTPDSLVARANEVLAQLSGAVTRIERVIDGSKYDFEVALENLRVTSDNLRELTETAREYPSLMILGEPPRASQAVSP